MLYDVLKFRGKKKNLIHRNPKEKEKRLTLTLATVPNTFQEGEERREEETEEGVVPKITFLPARQSLWLIPLSSHMQVTPYGCRRCPACPLTWSPTATVTWTVPFCLAFTCSSPWSSCCRWNGWPCIWKTALCVFLDFWKSSAPFSSFSSIIFSFHHLLSTFLLPSRHLLFFLWSFVPRSIPSLSPASPFSPLADPDSHLPLHFHRVGEDWSDLFHH